MLRLGLVGWEMRIRDRSCLYLWEMGEGTPVAARLSGTVLAMGSPMLLQLRRRAQIMRSPTVSSFSRETLEILLA